MQQIPRDRKIANLRGCFIASEGCKLVIVDMSQIELRIAADLAPDPLMIESFKAVSNVTNIAAVAIE